MVKVRFRHGGREAITTDTVSSDQLSRYANISEDKKITIRNKTN